MYKPFNQWLYKICVAQVTRPSTDKLKKVWHVTCDTWHMTNDMWHMTCDRWGEVNLLKNFSSLALTVWEWRCSEDLEEKYVWIYYRINDKGIDRTTPATPGLLRILTDVLHFVKKLLQGYFLAVFFVHLFSIFLTIVLPLYVFFFGWINFGLKLLSCNTIVFFHVWAGYYLKQYW